MIEILHFVQNDSERFRMKMNIQNDNCHPEQSEGSIK